MNYDDWKQEVPELYEGENNCAYCGEPCDGEFCSRECRKAYLAEN